MVVPGGGRQKSRLSGCFDECLYSLLVLSGNGGGHLSSYLLSLHSKNNKAASPRAERPPPLPRPPRHRSEQGGLTRRIGILAAMGSQLVGSHRGPF